jgi:electron transport complex protein RnfC
MTYPTKLPKGGVDPPSVTLVPPGSGIANAALPARALIPLLQHAGRPALCLVKVGDAVSEGMLIGKADGPRSANVHSSIPGLVSEIRSITLPTGETCDSVTIDLGGSFESSGKPRVRRQWEGLSPGDLLERIRAAGVVGLGGESIPTHLKLTVRPGHSPALLAANGLDCEPSLSADEALLRDKQPEILEGLRICQAILSPRRTVLALGDQSEELAGRYERLALQHGMKMDVVVLPSRYPQGHEQLVASAIEGGPPALNASVTVINVATLHAIFEAVVLDKPLIERVLTVTGPTLARPQNLKVRLGCRIGDLLEECGASPRETGKVVVGGPMRGVRVDSLDIPVTKGTIGLVVFDAAEARQPAELPCIRCGACIEACPWDLVPTRLVKLVRIGETATAMKEGLARCTECGCCSYSCPSRIPLSAILGHGRRGRAADGSR